MLKLISIIGVGFLASCLASAEANLSFEDGYKAGLQTCGDQEKKTISVEYYCEEIPGRREYSRINKKILFSDGSTSSVTVANDVQSYSAFRKSCQLIAIDLTIADQASRRTN